MKEQINKLVQEGEKLKETFNKTVMNITITNDRQAVSAWITKCMRVVEQVENQKEKSPIYIKLAKALNNVGNVNSDCFDELVGLKEGINETYEEEDVFVG